jgi:hypothetical protein
MITLLVGVITIITIQEVVVVGIIIRAEVIEILLEKAIVSLVKAIIKAEHIREILEIDKDTYKKYLVIFLLLYIHLLFIYIFIYIFIY